MGDFAITSVKSSRADSRVTWFRSTDVSDFFIESLMTEMGVGIPNVLCI